jgi:HAD superfamily hydrolase (TIGR01509 family)
VARQLAADARARGVHLAGDVDGTGDPFDVLRAAAAHDPAKAVIVESALRDAEVHAVATAPMTPGLMDALIALRASGHTITIVSNNSDAAVRAFLATRGLDALIDRVVARSEPDPALLKPHPHLVLSAMAANQTAAAACLLIGDSTAEITAAHRAGTAVVAYANKPGKRDALAASRPDALIDELADLTRAATLPYVF